MAAFTPNYGLHQWEPEDHFLRTDFNEDFNRIDTAIRAAKAQAEQLEEEKAAVVAGSYNGNNVESREIILGFRPQGVLVENSYGVRAESQKCRGGFALADSAVGAQSGGGGITITDQGFSVFHNGGGFTNVSGYRYHYLAIR